MSESKVRISLNDGLIEFEGSEAFVTAQVATFSEVIRSGLLRARPAGAGVVRQETEEENKLPEDRSVPEELLQIFAKNAEGALQILVDVPGSNGPEKTTNAAKLYLFGLQELCGKSVALFEEIKDVCKAHGFYDSGNMAGYLKADKQSFVFGGSGKKQTLQLTVPGKSSARKLVDQARVGTEE